jgi:hypothetical protein
MPIGINGSGTITGISAGGLPDNVIVADDIAAGAVAPAKLSTGAPSWDSSGNLSFNSGYGSVATVYGCRAWVNFNGTGTVAIRASGNVSSITDNSTGDYTVNFTTALPDANYSSVVSLCAAFGFRYALGAQINTIAAGAAEQAPTTSSFRFSCIETAATSFDPKYASVAIFR